MHVFKHVRSSLNTNSLFSLVRPTDTSAHPMVLPLEHPCPSARAPPRVHFGLTQYIFVDYEKVENANPEALLVECDACSGKFSRSPRPGCSMILKTSALNWLCTECFVAGAPKEYIYDSYDMDMESEQILECSDQTNLPKESPPGQLPLHPESMACLEMLPVLKKLSNRLAASDDQHKLAIGGLLLKLIEILQQKLSIHAKQKLEDEVRSMTRLHTLVKELADGLKRLQGTHHVPLVGRAPLQPLPNGQDPGNITSTMIRQLQKSCEVLLKEEVEECKQREIARAGASAFHDRLSCSLPRSLGRPPFENSAKQPRSGQSQAAATATTRPLAQRAEARRLRVTPRYDMQRQSSEPRPLNSGALSPAPPRERSGYRPTTGTDKGSSHGGKCKVASGTEKGFAGAARQRRFPSSSPPRMHHGQASSPSPASRQTSSGSYTARLSSSRGAETPHIVTARRSSGTPEAPCMKGPRMPFAHPCQHHLRKASSPAQADAYVKVGVRGGSLIVPRTSKINLDKAHVYKTRKM